MNNYTEEEKLEILLKEQEKYKNNLQDCIEASEVLRRRLSIISKEHKKHGYKIVYTTDRIKTENSFLEKVYRKANCDKPFNFENAHDIVGFRIICLNKADADAYKNYIVNSPLIKVIETKNYIENPKDSGYRSYHIIAEVPVETIDGIKNIKAEIQVRTILMDIYAREEHKLNYKADCSKENATKLRQLSRTLNFFEDSFDGIINRTKETLVEDDENEVEEFEKTSYLFDSASAIIKGKLNSLISEYPDKEDIAYKKDRIKPISSISRKLKMRKLSFTGKNIRTKISDVVGFKIVCMNQKEVKKLVEYIKKSKAFDISEEKDYITYPKESGYVGYHLKVKENVPIKNGTTPIVSEIQFRTMLMDAWTMHDDYVYGEDSKTPKEKEKLAELSAGLQLVANYLQQIKDEESSNVNSVQKRNFVKELEEYKNSKNTGKGSLKLKK